MEIFTPFTTDKIKQLKCGDTIFLSGKIYTARDAAHERMFKTLQNNEAPPFDYEGQAVFYAGPCPAPPGKPIGSIGPTTAGRMDAYAPALMAAGLRIMIGKGDRTPQVIETIKKHSGLYLVAVGGVAALMAKCVTHSRIIAYDDLGTEAIRELTIEKLPLVVAIDHLGNAGV